MLELLNLYDFYRKEGNQILELFFDPAKAPKKTRSVTSQQLKPLQQISAKLPLLLLKRLSYWNIIAPAVKEETRTNFKHHLESKILPLVTGEILRKKLRDGEVQSSKPAFWKL